jgi:hypothetical protein
MRPAVYSVTPLYGPYSVMSAVQLGPAGWSLQAAAALESGDLLSSTAATLLYSRSGDWLLAQSQHCGVSVECSVHIGQDKNSGTLDRTRTAEHWTGQEQRNIGPRHAHLRGLHPQQ